MKPTQLKNMSDHRLITIDLKVLHSLMEKAGYTEDEQEEVRARRRKLQNRNSAKTSAARKRKQYESMTDANKRLRQELEAMHSRVATLEDENAMLRFRADVATRRGSQVMQECDILKREVALLSSLLQNAQAEVQEAREATADSTWLYGVDAVPEVDPVSKPPQHIHCAPLVPTSSF
eukprot:m.429506 g.429506  ORF g.429506 m.429506 type:complete len:177 (+) comp17014_c0_seq1:434-964(+)